MVLPTIIPKLPIVTFADNTQAEVLRNINLGPNKQGEPMSGLFIKPTEYFKEVNDVKPEEYHQGTLLSMEIPTKTLIEISPVGSEKPAYFVMTDYRKRHTDFTKFFYCQKCGKGYHNVHDQLKSYEAITFSQKLQIAQLKLRLKKVSETLEIDLSNKAIKKIDEVLYPKIARLITGGRAESEEQN